MPSKKTDNIHCGHRGRVKERFLEEGMDNFAPHEVLEYLLFFTIPQGDTNPLAHDLIDRFGSLSRVLEADPRELCKVHGIGPHSALMISSILPVMRRYLAESQGEKPTLVTSQEAGEFAMSLCCGRENEVVLVICVDKAKRVQSWKILNEGGLDSTLVYPRMIAKEALLQQAWGVVLAHNHPSGVLKPSANDKTATKQIADALETVEVILIDHIIVSSSGFVSMGDLGLLSRK